MNKDDLKLIYEALNININKLHFKKDLNRTKIPSLSKQISNRLKELEENNQINKTDKIEEKQEKVMINSELKNMIIELFQKNLAEDKLKISEEEIENLKKGDDEEMIKFLKNFLKIFINTKNEADENKKELKEKSREIEKLEERKQRQENEIKIKKNEIDELNKTIEGKEEEINEFEKNLEILKKEKSKQEEKIKEKNEELDKKNSEINIKEKRIEKLEEEQREKENKIKNLNRNSKKLEEDLSMLEKEKKELKEVYEIRDLYKLFESLSMETKRTLNNLVSEKDILSFALSCSLGNLDNLWEIVNRDIKNKSLEDCEKLAKIFSYFIEAQNSTREKRIYGLIIPEINEKFNSIKHISMSGNDKISEIIFPGYGLLEDLEDNMLEEDRKIEKIKRHAIVR